MMSGSLSTPIDSTFFDRFRYRCGKRAVSHRMTAIDGKRTRYRRVDGLFGDWRTRRAPGIRCSAFLHRSSRTIKIEDLSRLDLAGEIIVSKLVGVRN